MHCQNVRDNPDLTHDENLRGPVKAYDNKTALLKCALKSIMDPPGGIKYFSMEKIHMTLR